MKHGGRRSAGGPAALAQAVLDALPQTQCTRCGYPDCSAYAKAIASGEAEINQCPPGGAGGIARLANLLQRPDLASLPLNPENGPEAPRGVAVIDEVWCIGCTLCLPACPTDAILGANKRMHTVIEARCTGCELCIPVCPVDCIRMEPLADPTLAPLTGWAAWSQPQADTARARYAIHQARSAQQEDERAQRHLGHLQDAATDIAAHSQATDPAVLDQKRAIVEAALARAKQKAGR